MGKAAKLKRMRKIASQLPVIERHHVQGERIIGSDLYAEGVEQVQGKDIVDGVYYRRKKVITVPINHAKAMKRNYNKFGMAGALGYARAVLSYENGRVVKAEEEKSDPSAIFASDTHKPNPQL